MIAKTIEIDEDVRFEVEVHPNFIAVCGYTWCDEVGRPEDEDFEDAGIYCTWDEKYVGYTVSESLCSALVDMSIAEDIDEAIAILEGVGVPYVSSEN